MTIYGEILNQTPGGQESCFPPMTCRCKWYTDCPREMRESVLTSMLAVINHDSIAIGEQWVLRRHMTRHVHEVAKEPNMTEGRLPDPSESHPALRDNQEVRGCHGSHISEGEGL